MSCLGQWRQVAVKTSLQHSGSFIGNEWLIGIEVIDGSHWWMDHWFSYSDIRMQLGNVGS